MTILFACLLVLSVSTAAEKEIIAIQNGPELAAYLRSLAPAEDSVFRGHLRIRQRGNPSRVVSFTNEIKVAHDSWQSVYQSQAVSGLPAEKLVITHRSQGHNEYEFARGTPENPHQPASLQRLSPVEAAIPFAGSDFFLSDFGLEFFHWPSQAIVDREMRKGRACKVLESRPAPGLKHPYGRVLSWIDNESGGLVMAEAFDPAGKRLKQFEVKSVKKQNGRWHLQEIEISTLPTHSRTRLEFDIELEEP